LWGSIIICKLHRQQPELTSATEALIVLAPHQRQRSSPPALNVRGCFGNWRPALSDDNVARTAATDIGFNNQ
jgi:hypothetical protein